MKTILQNKNRDEIFEFPLVYGQTIHYIPDIRCVESTVALSKYRCEYIYNKDILALKGLSGFENSLSFDKNGYTPTKLVYVAKNKEKIIGVAGAADTAVEGLWEIGIDVLEEYRNEQLGTYLVKGLTRELLSRNIIPFYSASITNIGSQLVASRSGYMPFWVDTFGTILDGSSVYNNLIKDLLSEFTR